MSIALSSVLIVAALIPGIAFLNSYYTGKFPRQLANLTPLAELALYFFWALPIDAIAIRLLHPQLDPAILEGTARVFGLGKPDASLGRFYPELLGLGWWRCLWSYVAVVVGAVVAGSITRRLVWASRLDAHVPMLRLKAEWFYVLLGRTPGVPWNVLPQADVLVQHPEGSRLYAGVVSGFEPSKEGAIEELYLLAAQRYKVDKTKGSARRAREAELVDVPGDILTIIGSQIHSINMRYYVVPGPANPWSRFWWRTTNFFSTFIKGE